MKTRKDKAFYIHRATEDFYQLALYFNCVRPKFQKAWQVDGRFSKELFDWSMEFFGNWPNQTMEFKKENARTYSIQSKAFNYCFDMPRELVQKVLGFYRDDNGRKIRIHTKDVCDWMVGKGMLRHTHQGKKVNPATGEVKFWWHQKYLLPQARRDELMMDDRYGSIYTMPGASARLKKIVVQWERSK